MKTLVLDLDDVLVHSDWSRERGWRTFKRPGAEDFLRTMSQYYEARLGELGPLRSQGPHLTTNAMNRKSIFETACGQILQPLD